MATNNNSTDILSHLTISPSLRARISIPAIHERSVHDISTQQKQEDRRFVLYLPTVNLRIDQNPAFALACHIANELDVPCVVLAVVLDDQYMPLSRQNSLNSKKPIVMTSRRLAFILEALSESCQEWSDHGAGCAIRVNGPKCRSPDHLTLSSRAMAVVTDEPFVNPFLTFALRVERTCSMSNVPFFKVDGSTTVPPISILKRKSASVSTCGESIYYTGVPSKAWQWQNITEPHRKKQLQAAMNGDFDAPILKNKINDDEFFMDCGATKIHNQQYEACCISAHVFPLMWKNRS
jgi:hypothetical protein